MTQIFIESKYEKTSEYVFVDTVIKNLGFFGSDNLVQIH